ncbi:hypothetical protein [Candidatus Vampirococcus lugosii]|uniref:Uncharacterized protein n=1 Tax=Candidatus Vampirococcus lugosii TaxID=2789015 RepID=A0ABS5QNI3_9BACT|nr:hypothetical protein [Candidatus Vampirococcus lugosii]MBS8122499.1 hypothetical protein [Candidatus Vampirococcus lugosii]
MLKNNKSFLLIIFVIFFLMPSFVFASGGEDTDFLIKFLNSLISLFSWFWIIPSIIAGTLMTNELVYGELMYLDKYLFEIWNMSKNFANFTLGFLFLFLVLKSFYKGEPGSVVKSYLPKITVAGVLIQMSWFLVAAIIDISIVAMSAVSTLPNYFVDSTDGKDNELTITMPEKCDFLKAFSDPNNVDICTGEIGDIKLNDISANALNASGPLLYFGFTVLKLQQFSNSEVTSWENITAEFLIKLFVVLMFTIPLIVLMVINFIRLFWLWMFIVFSPFVVLDSIFSNAVSSKMEGSVKKLTLSNFIGLAFQPVIVIGMLSVILIFVVGLNTIFQIDDNQAQSEDLIESLKETMGVFSSDNESGGIMLGGENGGQILAAGDIMSDVGNVLGGAIGYLVLAIFVSFMVWSLVKLSFKTSEITSGVSDSIFKFTEQTMKTVPIPGTKISYGALERGKSNLRGEIFGMTQAQQASGIESKLDSLFGNNGGGSGGGTSGSVSPGPSINSLEEQSLKVKIQDGNVLQSKIFWKEIIRLGESGKSLNPNQDKRLKSIIEQRALEYGKNHSNLKILTNGKVDRNNENFKRLVNYIMANSGDVPGGGDSNLLRDNPDSSSIEYGLKK